MTNSNHNNNTDDDNDDYYKILDIPYNADFKMIRKAYLKLSLQYHPDKNLNITNHNEQEYIKQQFIKIGRAYQTLSDPQQKKIYDLTYNNKKNSKNTNKNSYGKTNHQQQQQQQQRPQYQKQSSFASDFYNTPPPQTSSSSSSYNNNNNNNNQYYSSSSSSSSSQQDEQQNQQQQYETYRNFFDHTMANLSEDELNDILGAATMLSSIVGSIIGAKLLAGNSRTAHGSSSNTALRSIGAAVGSAIATHTTTSMIKHSHTQAKQRALLNNNNGGTTTNNNKIHNNNNKSTYNKDYNIHHNETRQQQSQQNSSSTYSGGVRDDHDTNNTNNTNNHWQEIVDNVISGPIAKEVGKVIQQITNDFINVNIHNNKTKNTTTTTKH